MLQAIHAFSSVAQAPVGESDEKGPLFALGHQPGEQQQPAYQQRGGVFGGGMMGGPFGGFLGGDFGQAMMMGGGIGLGESLIASIFRV